MARSLQFPSLLAAVGVDGSIKRAGDELRSTIEAARAAAMELQTKFNQDMTGRLTQADGIIARTIADINALQTRTTDSIFAIIERSKKDAQELLGAVSSELDSFIVKVLCGGKVLAIEDGKDVLGKIGRILGTHTIEISPPPLYYGEQRKNCLFDCELKESFKIKTPFQETYEDIKHYMNSRLTEIREDTSVRAVVTTYEYLAALAERTLCFIPEGGGKTIRLEAREFLGRSIAWDLQK